MRRHYERVSWSRHELELVRACFAFTNTLHVAKTAALLHDPHYFLSILFIFIYYFRVTHLSK